MGWTIIVADKILLRSIRRGDRAAAERFVSERYASIYRLLYHLTGSKDAADDLAQQTFVRAWQALPSFRGDASLLTWLHRIAYREYGQWRQGQARSASQIATNDFVPEEAFLSRTPHPAESLILRQALAQLPSEQQDAFLLYHVQGRTIREIAAIVDAPEGTIKHRLYTARHRLRVALAPATEATDVVEPTLKSPQSLTSCDTQTGVTP